MQFGNLTFGIEQDRLALTGAGEATQAEIVGAAFHQNSQEIVGNYALQEGNILVHELFLQGYGVGADDYALPVMQGAIDGGNKVCEALADAGSGLDHQVILLFKGFGDCGGHGHLRGAVFVTRHLAGDEAAGAENIAVERSQ